MQSRERYLQSGFDLHRTPLPFKKDLGFTDKRLVSPLCSVLTLIKDPLWRQVYIDAIKMMGPPAHQIWKAQLGPFSSKDTVIDLYCPTQKVAEFIEQYDFVILATLRLYFPSLKELRVKIN